VADSGGPISPAREPGTDGRAWLRRFANSRVLWAVVSLLFFAFLISRSRGRFIEATAWEVPLVLLLLVVSVAWRAVTARQVMTFFLLGFGPVFAGTVLVERALAATPLEDFLKGLSGDLLLSGVGTLGNVNATIWAPITEELGKIIPLLLLLTWGRSRLRTQGGPLDLAILAAATGAGLGVAEDLFQLGLPSWTTPESPLLGLGVGTAYLALVVNPIGIFEVPVVDLNLTYQGLVGIFDPSVEELGSGAVWAGHGVLPGLVGLALGFAVRWRRRYSPAVYLLPIAAFAWAVWDHFVANWYSARQCERFSDWTLCSLAGLDGVGAALPIVAILGFAGATLVARRSAGQLADVGPATSAGGVRGSTAWYRKHGGLWPIAYGLDLLRYWRLRARFANGWHDLTQRPPVQQQEATARLLPVQLGLLNVAARLRGEETPVAPERVRRLVGAGDLGL